MDYLICIWSLLKVSKYNIYFTNLILLRNIWYQAWIRFRRISHLESDRRRGKTIFPNCRNWDESCGQGSWFLVSCTSPDDTVQVGSCIFYVWRRTSFRRKSYLLLAFLYAPLFYYILQCQFQHPLLHICSHLHLRHFPRLLLYPTNSQVAQGRAMAWVLPWLPTSAMLSWSDNSIRQCGQWGHFVHWAHYMLGIFMDRDPWMGSCARSIHYNPRLLRCCGHFCGSGANDNMRSYTAILQKNIEAEAEFCTAPEDKQQKNWATRYGHEAYRPEKWKYVSRRKRFSPVLCSYSHNEPGKFRHCIFLGKATIHTTSFAPAS